MNPGSGQRTERPGGRILTLFATLALAFEPPPDSAPRFDEVEVATREASFDNGFRLLVRDTGEGAITVVSWVSGGEPSASIAAAELWYSRDLGFGTRVRDAYGQVGAASEAVVGPEGTLFIAVGPLTSLEVLLTLEQARLTASESRVSAREWELLQAVDVPWVRMESGETWAQPVLAAMYPEGHPAHPSPLRPVSLAEARGAARELYRPANTATVVLGALDESARDQVVDVFAEMFGAPAALPEPEEVQARVVVPEHRWVGDTVDDPTSVAVAWSLPGVGQASPAALQGVRVVVERELARSRRLAPECAIELGLAASTLVCRSEVRGRKARTARLLGKMPRKRAVEVHLEAVHRDWARQRLAQLASASWQADGRARREGRDFGQLGHLPEQEPATIGEVEALLRAHLGPDRAVATHLTE
ncbi:MAG: hypothetical protein EP330_10545 [Deltaproteobacteria bacterium]|nr:MAG: hypothetical protein EP330_10545 [Deltaproteobacteria bacterium]